MPADCIFCKIASGQLSAAVVLEDSSAMAFLDHRPLFPGHCLLIPKTHYETLPLLPDEDAARLMVHAKVLCSAMEEGLGADGSFVALNNHVSQSVPHAHFHIVPRRRKDGLRGFFWPRQKYRDASEMEATRAALRSAVDRIRSRAG